MGSIRVPRNSKGARVGLHDENDILLHPVMRMKVRGLRCGFSAHFDVREGAFINDHASVSLKSPPGHATFFLCLR